MKQILYEIKSQPLIAIVTVIGTSLAMFLIMVAVMLEQAKVMPMAPESARDRMLFVNSGRVLMSDGGTRANSSLSYATALELADSLAGAEAVAIAERDTKTSLIASAGQPTFFADVLSTDHRFFDVYDIAFLAGKPYTEADISSGLRKAVISEGVAREAFGGVPEDAVGKEVEIDDIPYTITGVVKDVSPITSHAYSQVWTAIGPKKVDEFWASLGMADFWGQLGLGDYTVVIKAESRDRFSALSDELNRRASIISTGLKLEDEMTFDLFGGPKDLEGYSYTADADNSDIDKAKRQQWFIYFILLLIPAINLSSMTRSRLRRRTGEIGVRRAFGCTRSRVIADILIENFVITLVGGLIGLAACFIFGSLMFDAIYSAGRWSSFNVPITISFGSLLDWRMFAYALFFCFVLNLLSTGIPAWRAARVNPVDAINSTIR